MLGGRRVHHDPDLPGCHARHHCGHTDLLAWEARNVQLTLVRGMQAAMRGKRQLEVTLAGHVVVQEVWLVSTANPCIIGLHL